MPKLYVAEEQVGADARKVACKSMTAMKTRLREFADTLWVIKTVTLKTDAASLCSLLEGTAPAVELAETVRVNASGQIRAVK